MADYFLARALHVLGVVLWIGGVAMVTTVLLPAVRRAASARDAVELFEQMEGGFARQARWTTLATGLSGFWLTYRLDLWHRFLDPAWWWMHAMVVVWLVFTLILFVLEPLWLHDWFRRRAQRDAHGTLILIERLHWVLLIASLVTLVGAAAGSHGWRLF